MNTYEINARNEVIPYTSGRKCTDTRAWRDATELELQQQDQIQSLERELTAVTEQRDRLAEAIQDAIDCGMIPITSAKEGGAAKYSIQVRTADKLREALQSLNKPTNRTMNTPTPKIIQLLMSPNDSVWQGVLLGLGDDGATYHCQGDTWQLYIPPLELQDKATEQRDGLRSGIDYASDQLTRVTEQRDKALQKIKNQAERIAYLEGATNHATGTPLSKAIEQRDRLAKALRKIQKVGLVAVDAFDELDRINEIVDEALAAVKGGSDDFDQFRPFDF